MREIDFRGALDDCLEQIRQGKSLEECLQAYPQHAERLEPFLRSAATLRGLGVPEPSTSGIQRARNNLLQRVAEGSGKEAAVVRGAFKFANLVGVAVAAVFVAGIGFAAAGTGIFSGGDDGHVEFNATVVSAAPTLLYVQNNDDNQYVYLVLSNQTQYQDGNGNAIGRTDVRVRDRVWVRAMPSTIGARFFDARLIRLGGPPPEETIAPTHEPTFTPAPEPTATPAPEPTATPEPTPKPATPKPTDKPATPKPTEKPVSSTMEFWGIVLGVSPSSLALQTEMGNVTVHVNGETQYPNGHPFVGVKVWVLGTKQADGSFIGHKVALKTAEFHGQVKGISGGTFIVNADGQDKTVHTNGATSFPAGIPVVGNTVAVFAYRMGDGSYLATDMTVKTEPVSFTGIIVAHNPAEFTIKVDVSGTHKIVCYEFAEIHGTLAVGVTVYVEVDHEEAGTYFAGLVKVMS